LNGLILFAHGARDARWAAPFEAVAERLRARQPTLPVRLAFLELMAPTLADAAAAMAAEGCTRLVVVPMFLGSGGHVRQDLPRLVDALRAAHPGLHVALAGAIGEQPEVLAAMADAALRQAAPQGDTA
jgi:sirohydrochlorin cobaltochelatase